jgi:hypothetical protein
MTITTKTKIQNTAQTSFVCISHTNKKSLLNKTENKVKTKNTIAIGEI